MAYLVIGLGPPALFLIRELTKSGERVYAIGKANDIGLHSRYGKKYTVQDLSELRETVNRIVSETHNNGDYLRTYIASSVFLDWILREWPGCFEELEVIGPAPSLLRKLNRKTDASLFFSTFGIGHPKFWPFCQYEEINSFPVILKWNSNLYCADAYKGTIPKTIIINNEDELLRVVRDVEQLGHSVKADLMFQEFLSSSDVRELGYGAFYRSGRELMSIIVEQARQYPRGVTSYAVECIGEESDGIRSRFAGILQKMNYSGFIEIDFLYSKVTNEILLLDVNPRVWGHIKILGKKYVNFADCITGSAAKGVSVSRPVQWVDFHRDVVAVMRNQRRSPSFKQFFNDVRSVLRIGTAVNTFEFSDPKPFLWGIPKKVLFQYLQARQRQ